jgi:protein-S-isoprenylcysteine O-methyltransferase Ste14
MFKRFLVLMFGTLTYTMFLGVFLYAAAFVIGLPVSRTMNGPMTYSFSEALPVNLMLVLVFGLQHSIMARPGFKRLWTRIIPRAIERNVYVLATNLALLLLFWQWRPIDMYVWNFSDSMLMMTIGYAIGIAGWLTVLVTTFLINHFDLFGLRQAWMYFRGRPYQALPFVTPGPYRIVRHPLYVGWLMAFWGTPMMSVAHLMFAMGMTIYILVAIQYEERDLMDYYGEKYRKYREQVPMLIPMMRAGKTPSPVSTMMPSTMDSSHGR